MELFKALDLSKGFFIDCVSLELSISPVLEIFPQHTVYEGDQLNILCNISNLSHSSDSVRLFLVQGTKLLSSGGTTVSHSMVALAKDPGKFECQLVIGSVEKVTTKQVLVTGEWKLYKLTVSINYILMEATSMESQN